MGEARRRKLAGTLPDNLAHPLKGSEEAIRAGMEMIDGEWRLSSLALANALGISHKKMLRWIEKHRHELEKLGPLVTKP